MPRLPPGPLADIKGKWSRYSLANRQAEGISKIHPIRRTNHEKKCFLRINPNTSVNHAPMSKKAPRPNTWCTFLLIQVPNSPSGFLELDPENSYWAGNGGSCPSMEIPRQKPNKSIPAAKASKYQPLGLVETTECFWRKKNKFLPTKGKEQTAGKPRSYNHH